MIPPIVDQIRAVARAHGWAIGVHGSLGRDIDLIAVPWVPDAAELGALVDAICQATGYRDAAGRQTPGLTPRGLGRFCALLLAPGAESEQMRVNRGEMLGPVHPKGVWWPPAIDLSLVDVRATGMGPA